MSKQDKIESVRIKFRTDSKHVENDPEKYESLKIKYLGRKGLIADLFSNIPNTSIEERPKYGKDLNKLKNEIASFFGNNKIKIHSFIFLLLIQKFWFPEVLKFLSFHLHPVGCP